MLGFVTRGAPPGRPVQPERALAGVVVGLRSGRLESLLLRSSRRPLNTALVTASSASASRRAGRPRGARPDCRRVPASPVFDIVVELRERQTLAGFSGRIECPRLYVPRGRAPAAAGRSTRTAVPADGADQGRIGGKHQVERFSDELATRSAFPLALHRDRAAPLSATRSSVTPSSV